MRSSFYCDLDLAARPLFLCSLMRDLVHAPVKKSVLIPDATHYVLFEKKRMMFFEEILQFLKQ